MAILEIPVRSDIPAYQFQVTLDGVVFTLKFRFNTRIDRWIMDVKDVDENSLVDGVPLLYGLPVLDRFVGDDLPLGSFVVIDETGEERNPTRDSFGEDFKLLYQEAG